MYDEYYRTTGSLQKLWSTTPSDRSLAYKPPRHELARSGADIGRTKTGGEPGRDHAPTTCRRGQRRPTAAARRVSAVTRSVQSHSARATHQAPYPVTLSRSYQTRLV